MNEEERIPQLTVEKLTELKTRAEMNILKAIREQVDWFEQRTGVTVLSVDVENTDTTSLDDHHRKYTITDVDFSIDL